jgi:hypothetical protein
MKRRKDRRLTHAERRSLFLVSTFLLAAIGLMLWFHLRQNEIVPPSEVVVRSGQDLRVPMAELSAGKARHSHHPEVLWSRMWQWDMA